MGNEVSNNNINAVEPNEPISRLIGTLKRVEAPKDFDFRLKARIAAGCPVDRTAAWIPAWGRYALPVVLLAAVGGYFGFNALYVTNPADSPVTAKTEVQSAMPGAPVTNSPVIETGVKPQIETAIARNETKPATDANKTAVKEPAKRNPSKTDTEQPRGGSIDLSSGAIEKKLDLRGFNANASVPENHDGIAVSPPISAKNVLKLLGVSASSNGSGWVVDAVSPGLMAAAAGVKAGDIIEAINGQVVSGKTTFPNGFTGKNLRIRRDGKSFEVNINH